MGERDIVEDLRDNATFRRDGLPCLELVAAREIAALRAELERVKGERDRLRRAIDSLSAWLLHRFGPDSAEGREATVARAALRQQEGSDDA